MKWRHAASIGSLLNNKGQSGPDMRDAAVFVSLLIPDTSVGPCARACGVRLGPVAQVVRAHP